MPKRNYLAARAWLRLDHHFDISIIGACYIRLQPLTTGSVLAGQTDKKTVLEPPSAVVQGRAVVGIVLVIVRVVRGELEVVMILAKVLR